MNDSHSSPIHSVDTHNYLLLLPKMQDDPNFNEWWQNLFDTNPSFADFLVKQANILCVDNPELTQKVIKILALTCFMIESARSD